jgi:hypothetical protein
MGTTPLYALPYPEPSEPADVPTDIHELATAVEGILRPTIVTTLPSTPFDKQEVLYTVDAANGIYWHLRYVAGASGAFKWAFVGGPPLYAEAIPDASGSMGSAAWGTFDANDPRVTVPLAGDYLARTIWGAVPATTTATCAVGVSVGGVNPAFPAAPGNAIAMSIGAGNSGAISFERKLTGLAAATLIRQAYWQNGGTQNVTSRGRSLELTPIRVG